jgi:hypothetical protein
MEMPPLFLYDVVLEHLYEYKQVGLRPIYIKNNLHASKPEFFINGAGEYFADQILDALIEAGFIDRFYRNGTDHFRLNNKGINLLSAGG